MTYSVTSRSGSSKTSIKLSRPKNPAEDMGDGGCLLDHTFTISVWSHLHLNRPFPSLNFAFSFLSPALLSLAQSSFRGSEALGAGHTRYHHSQSHMNTIASSASVTPIPHTSHHSSYSFFSPPFLLSTPLPLLSHSSPLPLSLSSPPLLFSPSLTLYSPSLPPLCSPQCMAPSEGLARDRDTPTHN